MAEMDVFEMDVSAIKSLISGTYLAVKKAHYLALTLQVGTVPKGNGMPSTLKQAVFCLCSPMDLSLQPTLLILVSLRRCLQTHFPAWDCTYHHFGPKQPLHIAGSLAIGISSWDPLILSKKTY